MAFGKLVFELGGQFLHLFFEGFVVFFDGFTANVAAGSKNVILFGDLFGGSQFAKAGDVLVFVAVSASPVMVGIGDLLDIFFS